MVENKAINLLKSLSNQKNDDEQTKKVDGIVTDASTTNAAQNLAALALNPNIYSTLLLKQLQLANASQQPSNIENLSLSKEDNINNNTAGLFNRTSVLNSSLLGLSQVNARSKIDNSTLINKSKNNQKKSSNENKKSISKKEFKKNTNNSSLEEDAESTESGNNKKRSRNKSSNYRGVSRCAKDGRWQARIRIGKSVKYLGRYKLETDAAKRYDIAARAFHGNRAVLNFANLENLTVEDLEEGDKDPERKSDDDNESLNTESKSSIPTNSKRKESGSSMKFEVAALSLPNTKRQRRASAIVKSTSSKSGTQDSPVALRRNSLPPAPGSKPTDLYRQSPSYHQLLAQCHLLSAAGMKYKNDELASSPENWEKLLSNPNPLLLSLASGMLAGAGNLSGANPATERTVPTDASIASQLSPASKSMTGAISALISLNAQKPP